MYTVKGGFRRHWRLVSMLLGVIALFWLLYALRSVFLPFILGLGLVYLLVPVVSWLEKRLPYHSRWQKSKRVSMVILVFIVLLGLISFMSYYIITAVIEASVLLVNNAPQYIGAGLHALQQWGDIFREQLPPEMRQQVDTFIVDAGVALGNVVREAFLGGINQMSATFSMFFGFAALPIFLFYILKDSEKLRRGFYAELPSWAAEHTRNIISIVERVFGRYVRAQLMLGLVVAYFCFIGLLFLRIPFAPALAVFAGLTEFIPIIGPWIGGAAAVIVALAVTPERAIWVVVLYLSVQLLENTLLVPRIQGAYLRINPAILVVLLVLGSYIAGFWGIILAAPLAATGIEIYRYVRERTRVEEEIPTLGTVTGADQSINRGDG